MLEPTFEEKKPEAGEQSSSVFADMTGRRGKADFPPKKKARLCGDSVKVSPITFFIPQKKMIYSLDIPITEKQRKFLTKKEVSYIAKVQQTLRELPSVDYYNCAVRGAVSSFGELYKNSKDAGASLINLQFYKAGNLSIVEIIDNGSGFPDSFLKKFAVSSTTYGNYYPNLRVARDHTIPYYSEKHEIDGSKVTLGGSGLGLYYLALITQGDPEGMLYLNNREDKSSGACITLVAGTVRAAYDLNKIIEYRSEKGQEPVSPDDLLYYAPPAPRPGSPVPH